YFLSYLIASSIQMGATIDYAIVITNRYLELRTALPGKKDAIVQSLDNSFATVITSGSILTSAGYLIGAISSNSVIAQLGFFLGRGTLISIILVMSVLPIILYLCDPLFDRMSFSKKAAQDEEAAFGSDTMQPAGAGALVSGAGDTMMAGGGLASTAVADAGLMAGGPMAGRSEMGAGGFPMQNGAFPGGMADAGMEPGQMSPGGLAGAGMQPVQLRTGGMADAGMGPGQLASGLSYAAAMQNAALTGTPVQVKGKVKGYFCGYLDGSFKGEMNGKMDF
nr:MMPL family transporter [Lachnospiraceae bacterium]